MFYIHIQAKYIYILYTNHMHAYIHILIVVAFYNIEHIYSL